MPVASTEVVLAERLNSARPGAARSSGAFSVPFAATRLGRTFHSSLIPALGLDPRDVTGIQCAQVLGHGRIISWQHRVIHGADAPWLDSCDKHSNEGAWWYAAVPLEAACA
ncbi:hypothetical protein CUJ84_Chr002656 [Rhizobium leguminosarum]|uniref:Uncharacterized protein n=1 Tax=Rhizobium leguminosarum TaxID=384 RepID=A0A2K9Z441_RHILE|nr:hypothetical protein CUJ84_Chr002656 [Rhizobium leguminosarum]